MCLGFLDLFLLFPLGSDRYLGPRDTSRLGSRDPSGWTVEDVMQFVREADPQLGPHADLFRKHVTITNTMGDLWGGVSLSRSHSPPAARIMAQALTATMRQSLTRKPYFLPNFLCTKFLSPWEALVLV